MKLDRQIKKWEQEFNMDAIINAIEKLRPEERTPDLKLELANSYLNRTRGDWRRRKEIQKALKILEPLEDDFEGNFIWPFSMGNVLYNLDQWTRAYHYLSVAEECLVPANAKKMIGLLKAQCDQNVLRPRFRQPFESRVQQVWTEFKKVEEHFRRQYQKKKIDYMDASSKCDTIFDQAIEHSNVWVDVYEKNLDLIFMGNDRLLRLFEVQYLKDHAPASIERNWHISVGLLPDSNDWVKAKDPENEVRNISFELVKEEDSIFYMNAYFTEFDEKEDTIEEGLEVVEGWLVEVVGSVVAEKFFKLETMIEDPKDKKLIPLLELPKFLQEKGIDIHSDTRDLLDLKVSYTREKKTLKVQSEYREDIEYGWTKCPKFLKDYYDRNNFEDVAMLEADGSSIGCIFYRTDNFTGSEREKEIAEFQNSLKEYLTEKAGSDAFEIVGEAHGSGFEYLDIIGYNIQNVLQAAFEFFQTSSVPFSGYHPLRRYAGSVRLTGENFWIPYKGQESKNPLINPFWNKKNSIQ